MLSERRSSAHTQNDLCERSLSWGSNQSVMQSVYPDGLTEGMIDWPIGQPTNWPTADRLSTEMHRGTEGDTDADRRQMRMLPWISIHGTDAWKQRDNVKIDRQTMRWTDGQLHCMQSDVLLRPTEMRTMHWSRWRSTDTAKARDRKRERGRYACNIEAVRYVWPWVKHRQRFKYTDTYRDREASRSVSWPSTPTRVVFPRTLHHLFYLLSTPATRP